MTTYPELIRRAASGVHEVRRTGRRDLTTLMIRDLFLIADSLEQGQSAEDALQAILKASAGKLSPLTLGRKDQHCEFVVTFQGEAWVRDHAIPVDDAHFTFLATAEEVAEAHDGYGVFDALTDAERAPAEVRDWSGPFSITVERRPYRITGCAALDSFADDLAGLREVLAELEPTEAGLAAMFLPRETPDPDSGIAGLVGQMFVDNRRWDVILQDPDLDPEDLAKAA